MVDRSVAASVSFPELIRMVQSRQHQLPLFATIAWSIWHHRNKSRLQQSSLPLNKIAGYAKEYIRGFKNLQQQQQIVCRKIQTRKWSPPGSGMMKTNFDGALFGESDQAGLGVVIRNSEGQVMATLLEKIQKPHSVQSVELLTARRAVTFCIETGFQNSIFEGDSELVIKSLRGKGLVNSQDGHIIKDILSYANSLQSFSFSHVSRQGMQ
ncbi:uncharacterized protein LOC126728547 [Quercus robur]|uniref:uncharacterized protein LOC126728547 n=1 Tax=Quercus robur TaxID=38942 RepID=UPI0021638754|nr:uncharacterized protein LOC126728547 [Quercus robur]